MSDEFPSFATVFNIILREGTKKKDESRIKRCKLTNWKIICLLLTMIIQGFMLLEKLAEIEDDRYDAYTCGGIPPKCDHCNTYVILGRGQMA